MLRFILMMLIPLWVLVYTVQFGRWVKTKQNVVGSIAAIAVGASAFVTSGWLLWRMSHPS